MGFIIPIMRHEAIIFRKPEGERFREARRRVDARKGPNSLLRSNRLEA
jgi:hypothetical protein